MNSVAHLFLVASLLLSSSTVQNRSDRTKASSTAYKLVALKITGTTSVTSKEILAATGLQIGRNASDGDFKEAVHLLGDSGLFSGVTYSYSSSGTGVKLELLLTDIDKDKLVPARFENFVWFTDNELRSELRTRVPLFKDLLPLNGNLTNHVTEALRAVLAEKRYPGRVDFIHNDDGTTVGLTAIVYRVEEINIRIRGIEFPGASPEQAALLTAAAERVSGSEYGRSSLAAVVKSDLLPVYLRLGYLKADFGPSDAHVLPQTTLEADGIGPPEVLVDAVIPLTPGNVYSTSGIDLKGNSAIASGVLAPLFHLPTGQPADGVRLLNDIERVSKLYRSRGYVMVQIKPTALFNEEKRIVKYELDIVEGDLYKMGELDITGLDTQAEAQAVAAWTLRQGQPYDADYPERFREDFRRLLPHSDLWHITIRATPDARDKTVDVEVHFKQE
jgi:outer membrane protein assembly factor BamA